MMLLKIKYRRLGCAAHALQHVAEIGKFFRPMFFAGTVEFSHKRFHAVEAGFIKRLKM